MVAFLGGKLAPLDLCHRRAHPALGNHEDALHLRHGSDSQNLLTASVFERVEQLRLARGFEAELTIAAIIGSRGSSAMRSPRGRVKRPSSSIAFSEYRNSRERTIMSLGGGLMKSNLARLSMPSAFNCRRYMLTSERTSSGGVVIGIGESGLCAGKLLDGKRRKHLPADVRPARPARWFTEANEHGVTVSTSIAVRGLNVLSCDW